jgi:hypothetical protein
MCNQQEKIKKRFKPEEELGHNSRRFRDQNKD